MADPYKVLDLVLDEELASAKREILNRAANSVLSGNVDGDTFAELTIWVDFNAILRSATSGRTIREVSSEEGAADHSPTEAT